MSTANTPSQITGANQVTQQQIQPGQDLLISPLTKISDGTTQSITTLKNLLNKFRTIPNKINQLRNKGSGQVAALQKELNDAKTTLANENNAYVNDLVKRINNINASLDGLKNNITSLGSKADEITTALGQANSSTAGGPTSPRGVAPGPVNATNVGQQNTPLTTEQRRKISANQNRQGSNNVSNMVAGLGIKSGTPRRGGKRSRKIRRKYSKKHSKKLRRSSK